MLLGICIVFKLETQLGRKISRKHAILTHFPTTFLRIQGLCLNCVEDGNNPEKSNYTWEGGVSFLSEAWHQSMCKSKYLYEEEKQSWYLLQGFTKLGCIVCIKHKSIFMKMYFMQSGGWMEIWVPDLFGAGPWHTFRKLDTGMVLLASSGRTLVLSSSFFYV